MIHPNMATLLSVITTDANVDPSLWHTILLHGVQKSFNCTPQFGPTLGCNGAAIVPCTVIGSAADRSQDAA